MRASDFEFRYRFWILLAIYGIGFATYNFDYLQTAGWLARHLPASHAAWRILLALAALLAVAAAVLRTWATGYLHTAVVHDVHLHSDRLVADGPYRHTRNPLYLGGILLAAGFGLLASRAGWIILVGGHLLLYARLMAREEAQLSATQGDPYLAFRRQVPRLWPSWRPRWPASGAAPHWGQAFFGEILLWICAAGVVAYAVHPKLVDFYWVVGIGLALAVALRPIWHRLPVPGRPAAEDRANGRGPDAV